jgi:hypothetical protein
VTAFIRTLQKASSRYCRADLDIVLKPTNAMGALSKINGLRDFRHPRP